MAPRVRVRAARRVSCVCGSSERCVGSAPRRLMGSDTVVSGASWNVVRLSVLLSSLDLPPRVKRRVRFLPLGTGGGGE